MRFSKHNIQLLLFCLWLRRFSFLFFLNMKESTPFKILDQVYEQSSQILHVKYLKPGAPFQRFPQTGIVSSPSQAKKASVWGISVHLRGHRVTSGLTNLLRVFLHELETREGRCHTHEQPKTFNLIFFSMSANSRISCQSRLHSSTSKIRQQI